MTVGFKLSFPSEGPQATPTSQVSELDRKGKPIIFCRKSRATEVPDRRSGWADGPEAFGITWKKAARRRHRTELAEGHFVSVLLECL
jgi:hypothetical protein